ncbi:MFS transporter [Achromobacter animicus]|uniref:MFS transporter n=1 Tax=Achromobacter animicus TaxID=1389935 RepID=UPI0028B08228|nr:MFS transporter [Achromobacter animicus]
MASSSKTTNAERRKVIVGSSLGTAFEWYDFHLYGTLAPVIAKHFFTGVSDSAAFIFALLTFAAGFVGRPFGSLVFGRLGDVIGRKATFLITIVLMALPTFFVGLLPGYATWGVAAPIILIAFRILQGLAAGGEYGGALVYVAEHSPAGRRGQDTSWINAMGATGIILALTVVIVVRTITGEEAFNEWAWRLPFVLSLVLFGISMWIRMTLKESPVFAEMKAAGKISNSPIKEAFGNAANVKTAVLLALGGTAAVGVMAYTSQFYTQFFLAKTLRIDPLIINEIVIVALVVSTPVYIAFGWLSDRIGRKPVIMGGALIAAFSIQPAFHGLTHFGNPALEDVQKRFPVVIQADRSECSFQFALLSAKNFKSSCDVAQGVLSDSMVNYDRAPSDGRGTASIKIGDQVISSFDGTRMTDAEFETRKDAFQREVGAALAAHGYPKSANSNEINKPMLIVIVTFLLILYGAIYSPIGAWMVELFPSRIRYTAISLPYNVGAGWVGGFMPATAFAMVAANGNVYFGLWYPIAVLVLAVVVGTLFLPETKDVDLENISDAHRGR